MGYLNNALRNKYIYSGFHEYILNMCDFNIINVFFSNIEYITTIKMQYDEFNL